MGIEPMLLSHPGKCATSVATGVLPKKLVPQADHKLDLHQLWLSIMMWPEKTSITYCSP